MRPVPVLLYLMQPAALQRPAAQIEDAQVPAARRARHDEGVFASGRRLLQLAWRLLPA
jgi:hypothetical protein